MLLTWDEVARREDLVGGDVVVINAASRWTCPHRRKDTLVLRAHIAEISHEHGLATVSADWVTPQVASSDEWQNEPSIDGVLTVRTYTRPICSLDFPACPWYTGTSYPLTGCLLWFFAVGRFELLDVALTAGLEMPKDITTPSAP
jgi:hypothetical protein